MNLVKSEPQPLPPPAIAAEAEEHRNQLAMAARSVTAITDLASNNAARNAAVAIREWCKQVEAERVRLTKPLLDGQRMLKRLAEDHLQPIESELARLERLAADWLLAEQRRVDRERAEQDAKLAQLMQERLALEAAAAKAAAEVTTEAQLAQAVEIELNARHAAAMVQQQVAEPLATVDKARGQSIRPYMDYEITDMEALRKAKPDCVKLIESRAMILELCCPNDGTPGIRCWYVYKSTFSTR